MDLLKEEILKKRQSLAAETGGKRFFKRSSEIEQKKIQQLHEQEKRELEAKALRQSGGSASASKSNPSTSSTTSAAASSTATASKSLQDDAGNRKENGQGEDHGSHI